MPDPRSNRSRTQGRAKPPRVRGPHRQGPSAPPRHARSTGATTRALQQRQIRLARTVVAGVVVLTFASAMSGYLLHGPGQSAGAQPTGSARPAPTLTARSSTVPPTASAATAATAPKPSRTPSPKASGARRAPAPVPSKGDGTFTAVQVPQTTTATTGRVVTYSLQIEDGMHANAASVARDFGSALLDRRGWQDVDHVRFVQVTPSQLAAGTKPQVTVIMASPDQVDKLCAPLPTHGDTSCDTSRHVVLNYKLWMRGVVYFDGRLGEYRDYMVNHEVGHALGHGHQLCSKPGAYAPVMEQQTLGLQGCKAWPWPRRPNAQGRA